MSILIKIAFAAIWVFRFRSKVVNFFQGNINSIPFLPTSFVEKFLTGEGIVTFLEIVIFILV